jgi:hypothetical protein
LRGVVLPGTDFQGGDGRKGASNNNNTITI